MTLTFSPVFVMGSLPFGEGLSHSVVKGVGFGIVEHQFDHVLEVFGCFREEAGHLARPLHRLNELCLLSVG